MPSPHSRLRVANVDEPTARCTPPDEKLNEARLEAGAILAMPDDEVLKLFHRKRKQRKLGRLVRHLLMAARIPASARPR